MSGFGFAVAAPERVRISLARSVGAAHLGMFQALVAGVDALSSLDRGDWEHAALVAEQVLTRSELPPRHPTLPW
jgi:hypothetical protein